MVNWNHNVRGLIGIGIGVWRVRKGREGWGWGREGWGWGREGWAGVGRVGIGRIGAREG